MDLSSWLFFGTQGEEIIFRVYIEPAGAYLGDD